jgi:hypothetical protein
VLSFFDFLGELGSTIHYFYRSWFFLLFPSYRLKVKREYECKSEIYVRLDIFLSLMFFLVSVGLFTTYEPTQ